MTKRTFAFLLALVMCFVAFAPCALAEEATDRGNISYGALSRVTDNLVCEAHTEISLTGYEEVNGEMHAIAMVTAEGSPNMVIICDLDTDEILHVYETPAGTGGYGYRGDVHEEDGRMVMGCGNELGVYNPATKEFKMFAAPPMNISGMYGDIRIDEKRGLIYSTESNRYNLNVTNIDTGASSTLVNLADYNSLSSWIGETEDYLYINGKPSGEESYHLLKIEKDTGTIVEVVDNKDDDIYGGYIYNRLIGDWMLTQVKNNTTGETENLAYNVETGEWKELEAPIKTSMMTFPHEGKIVYLNSATNKFVTVDENLKTEYTDVAYGSHLRGTGPWIKLKDQVNYPGYSFVTAQFSGNIYAINLQSGKTKQFGSSLPGPSLPLRISYLNPADDKLYIGAFKGGFGAEYDTKTGAVRYMPTDQPEGMTYDPATGFFYHGDYSGAHIWEIDPSKELSRNLRSNYKRDEKIGATYFGQVQRGEGAPGYGYQDRPFDLEVVGRELYVGTLANGNRNEGVAGALSCFNLDTFEQTVWEGIVPLHGVCTITHSGKYLYGGTTANSVSEYIDGDNVAKVFKFDTETKELVKVVDVEIPGVTKNPVIRSLEFGPDGTLYVGNDGFIAKMDPETLEITQYNVYGKVVSNLSGRAQLWHERKLHFDKQTGYMFGNGGMIFDPDTLEVVCEAPGYGFFSGIDSKGFAWFVNETSAYKAPVIRGDDKSYLVSGTTFFKTGEGRMFRNGDEVPFNTYNDNGRVMVPMRAAATAMGGSVTWDAKTNIAKLTNAAGEVLSFTTGGKVVTFPGNAKKFGVNLKVENGVTYIPMQTLCDFLNVELVEARGINFIAAAGSNYKPSGDLLDYIESEVYSK